MKALILLLVVVCVGCADPNEKANELFVEAVKLIGSANEKSGEAAIKDYEQGLANIQTIIDDYSESDLAVKLISGETLFTGKSLKEIKERVKELRELAKEQRRAEEQRRVEDQRRAEDRTIWEEYIDSHSIKPIDIEAIIRKLAVKYKIDNLKPHSSLIKNKFNTFETIATTIDCKLSTLEVVGIMKDLLDSPKMVRVSNFAIRPSEDRKELLFKATVICSNVRRGIVKTDPVLIREGSILIREYNELREKPLNCLQTVFQQMPEGLLLDIIEYNDSKKSGPNLLLIGSCLDDMGKQVYDYSNALANTEKLDANGDYLKLFAIVREVPFAGVPKKRWRLNCILNQK